MLYSKRKFNAMLKQWNLAKNLTSSNARFMRKKVEQRRDGFNKDTEFLLMKRPIPKDKYMRSTPTDDGYGKAVVPNGIHLLNSHELACLTEYRNAAWNDMLHTARFSTS